MEIRLISRAYTWLSVFSVFYFIYYFSFSSVVVVVVLVAPPPPHHLHTLSSLLFYHFARRPAGSPGGKNNAPKTKSLAIDRRTSRARGYKSVRAIDVRPFARTTLARVRIESARVSPRRPIISAVEKPILATIYLARGRQVYKKRRPSVRPSPPLGDFPARCGSRRQGSFKILSSRSRGRNCYFPTARTRAPVDGQFSRYIFRGGAVCRRRLRSRGPAPKAFPGDRIAFYIYIRARWTSAPENPSVSDRFFSSERAPASLQSRRADENG